MNPVFGQYPPKKIGAAVPVFMVCLQIFCNCGGEDGVRTHTPAMMYLASFASARLYRPGYFSL